MPRELQSMRLRRWELKYGRKDNIVSIFFGNPFSHRETLLFFEMREPGWISTRPYLLVLCGNVCDMYWNTEIQCPPEQRQRSGLHMTANSQKVKGQIH